MGILASASHSLVVRATKETDRKPLILLGFQRFLSSDIFDYFAVMSDFLKSLENRLSASPQGFESLSLRQSELRSHTQFFYFSLKGIPAIIIPSIKLVHK